MPEILAETHLDRPEWGIMGNGSSQTNHQPQHNTTQFDSIKDCGEKRLVHHETKNSHDLSEEEKYPLIITTNPFEAAYAPIILLHTCPM